MPFHLLQGAGFRELMQFLEPSYTVPCRKTITANIYTYLSVIARQVLAIPATSTTSERVFSKAGHICSKLRSSLAPENLDMLIFLAQNREIYANEADDTDD